MGLICNGHRNGFSPFRWMNGNLTTIQNGISIRNGYLPGKLHNWSWHAERQTSLPNGNLHPYGWMLPRTGGGMSMRTEGDGSMSAGLVPTINGSIDFTGSGDLSADAALIISMFCDMSGSGTLSASIVGLLNMSIDFIGSGDLSANLSAIGNMLLNLEGSGDIDATIAAYGNMQIEIVVTGTGLTVENVGDAVWSALSADFNEVGTMGNKMNSAASAGDPWGTELPGSYPEGTAGEILGNMSGSGGGDTILNSGTIEESTKFRTKIDSLASSDDMVYLGCKIVIIAGTGTGQVRVIGQYDGSNKMVIPIYHWHVTPDNTSQYIIIP